GGARVGGAAEQVTAVIVEPTEDLHAAAVPELPVGEVRLPALVGLRRLEADEGAPRPLPGLRRDEVRGVQDAADARQGRRLQPLTLKVPGDRGRPVVGPSRSNSPRNRLMRSRTPSSMALALLLGFLERGSTASMPPS